MPALRLLQPSQQLRAALRREVGKAAPVLRREGDAEACVRMRLSERCSGECGGVPGGVPPGLLGAGGCLRSARLSWQPTGSARSRSLVQVVCSQAKPQDGYRRGASGGGRQAPPVSAGRGTTSGGAKHWLLHRCAIPHLWRRLQAAVHPGGLWRLHGRAPAAQRRLWRRSRRLLQTCAAFNWRVPDASRASAQAAGRRNVWLGRSRAVMCSGGRACASC